MANEVWKEIDDFRLQAEAEALAAKQAFEMRQQNARNERLARLRAEHSRVNDTTKVIAATLGEIEQGESPAAKQAFEVRQQNARNERIARLSAEHFSVNDAAKVIAEILRAIEQGSPDVQAARMRDLLVTDTTIAIAGMGGEEEVFRTSTTLTLRWGKKLPSPREQEVIDGKRNNLLIKLPRGRLLADYRAMSVLVTPHEVRFNPGNAVFLDSDSIVSVKALLQDKTVAYPAFARAFANPQRVSVSVASGPAVAPAKA